MNTLSMADVVKSIRDLPSLPTIVMDLLSSFEQPDINVGILADKVSQDQALAAKTLRLANSSFYGLSRKVTTIQQAITILGFDSVRALISAASITSNFRAVPNFPFNFSNFWRHAAGTALCSKQIAKIVGLNQDYAFVCGLLHDIGILVSITRFPQHYQEALKYRNLHDCHVIEAEKAVIGVDHTVVGHLLAENWKFPAVMQRAILNHHMPTQADMGGIPSVVHVANAIVHALDITDDSDDLIPDLSDEAWRSLNLSTADLHFVYRRTEAEFEEVCQILTSGST